MVGIKLQGRLGNQMFQTTFISVLSRQLQTGYFLVQKPWKEVLILTYFNVKGFTYFNFYRNITWYYILKGLGIVRPQEISNYELPEKQLHLLTGNKLYSGFFQSELYFLGQEEYTRQLFTIKKKYIQLYNDTYGSIMQDSRTIVIHIRRGDYLQLDGIDHSLPITYYQKCLSMIEDNNRYKKIFISDDADWVKEQFSGIPDAIFCSNHMMTDFQIMIHANIILVANSSFSWWGAWLNTKNAVVYAPKHWLGYRQKETYPLGIICKKWIAVE